MPLPANEPAHGFRVDELKGGYTIRSKHLIEYELEIASGGSPDVVTQQTISLERGIIGRIEVLFPPGPSGLVGVKCYKGGLQIIPQSYGEWLIGDDIVVPHVTPIDMMTTPYTVMVEGYNSDESYNHTITFRFYLMWPEKEGYVQLKDLMGALVPENLPELAGALPFILEELEALRKLTEEEMVPKLAQLSNTVEKLLSVSSRALTLSDLLTV